MSWNLTITSCHLNYNTDKHAFCHKDNFDVTNMPVPQPQQESFLRKGKERWKEAQGDEVQMPLSLKLYSYHITQLTHPI